MLDGRMMLENRRTERCRRIARVIYNALFGQARGPMFHFAIATMLLCLSNQSTQLVIDSAETSERVDVERGNLIKCRAHYILCALGKMHTNIVPHIMQMGVRGVECCVQKFEDDELELPVFGFFVSDKNVKQIFNVYGGLGDMLSVETVSALVHCVS